MRTTLTLDDDLARRLKEVARQQRLPFKDVVNNLLRKGLAGQETARDSEPYRVDAFTSGFRPGVDPLRLNQLLDELDARRALEETHSEVTAG
jgi:hypothetical protein